MVKTLLFPTISGPSNDTRIKLGEIEIIFPSGRCPYDNELDCAKHGRPIFGAAKLFIAGKEIPGVKQITLRAREDNFLAMIVLSDELFTPMHGNSFDGAFPIAVCNDPDGIAAEAIA